MTTSLPLPNQPLNLTIYPDYCHVLSPTIGKWVPLRAIDVSEVRDVGMFSEGKKLYHLLNHPIKWVRLTGVVVAVDEYTNKEGGRRVFTLDDSSGICIECAALNPPKLELDLERGFLKHLDQLAQIARAEESKAKARDDVKQKKSGCGKTKEEKTQPSVQAPNIPWEEVDVGTVVKVKGRIAERWDTKQVEVVKIEVLRCTDAEVKCWDELRTFREETSGKAWVLSPEEEEKCRKIKERELRKARKRGAGGAGGASDRTNLRSEKIVTGSKGVERRKVEESGKRNVDERKEKFELEEKAKRRKESDQVGLGKKNRSNYPSYATRRAPTGKKDGL